jgi:hypothetical protein
LGITGNQVAFSIPDATIKIFGSVSPFSTRVNSAVMFGDTLTTTQAGAYQALVNAYMAVFGVSVY